MKTNTTKTTALRVCVFPDGCNVDLTHARKNRKYCKAHSKEMDRRQKNAWNEAHSKGAKKPVRDMKKAVSSVELSKLIADANMLGEINGSVLKLIQPELVASFTKAVKKYAELGCQNLKINLHFEPGMPLAATIEYTRQEEITLNE